MNKEEWKPVVGFEGIYEVSSIGRVKSLWFGKEKVLKPQKDSKGYFRVDLWKNGQRKRFRVHRLVATAFIPNPNNYPYINHKDEVKTNNIVSNLEFCDAKYNNNYGTRTQRTSKPVMASKYPDFRTIDLFFVSIAEADRNGYYLGNVSACCRGCYCREGNNKYKNLYWRFEK